MSSTGQDRTQFLRGMVAAYSFFISLPDIMRRQAAESMEDKKREMENARTMMQKTPRY